MKGYRSNVFDLINGLKRLDGVQKSLTNEFNNGNELSVGKKKEVKIELKSIGPFYTANGRFPSTGQYSSPVFMGESGLKKSLGSCKDELIDL